MIKIYLNLGCPGAIASSGINIERLAPLSGVGLCGGKVKSEQPSLEKKSYYNLLYTKSIVNELPGKAR